VINEIHCKRGQQPALHDKRYRWQEVETTGDHQVRHQDGEGEGKEEEKEEEKHKGQAHHACYTQPH